MNWVELLRSERFDEAIEGLIDALVRRPGDALLLHQLGVAYRGAGRLALAVECYRRALSIEPGRPNLLHDLGNALADLKQLAEAVESYRRALELRPDWGEAWNHLGTVLLEMGKSDEAISCHEQALALLPADARTLCFLGDAHLRSGRVEEAMAWYRRGLEQDAGDRQLHNNLGGALMECGRVEEAAACFERALALRPGEAGIVSNLGQALLTLGRLEEGWRVQELRWVTLKNRSGPLPGDIWDGGDLRGRSLLVHSEQGFGDTIQFIRYAPLLAERGARVFVECQAELRRLLEGAAGIEKLLVLGEERPAVDLRTLMMSLPAKMGTTLATIPASRAYLRAPAEIAQRWRERVRGDGARLKVGLVWAGNPRHKNDRNRSMELEMLSPLRGLEGVSFYSLQKGPAAAQTPESSDLKLIDHSAELTDFAQTAGLIEQLDLVIAVDTAVAHLAGALGKKVWVMLPFAADWRWLLEREDSPWYPTMKLFRQKRRGNWGGVVAQVGEELRKEMTCRRDRTK